MIKNGDLGPQEEIMTENLSDLRQAAERNVLAYLTALGYDQKPLQLTLERGLTFAPGVAHNIDPNDPAAHSCGIGVDFDNEDISPLNANMLSPASGTCDYPKYRQLCLRKTAYIVIRACFVVHISTKIIYKTFRRGSSGSILGYLRSNQNDPNPFGPQDWFTIEAYSKSPFHWTKVFGSPCHGRVRLYSETHAGCSS